MIPPMEAHVVHSICTQLENLGWIVNETNIENNVTQQCVKTPAQQRQLANANGGRLRHPDFVLYQRGTDLPICVIAAKRPGESLERALRQAEDRYAVPLNAPLIFAYHDTFIGFFIGALRFYDGVSFDDALAGGLLYVGIIWAIYYSIRWIYRGLK